MSTVIDRVEGHVDGPSVSKAKMYDNKKIVYEKIDDKSTW